MSIGGKKALTFSFKMRPVRPERELVDMLRKLLIRDPEGLLEIGRDDSSARSLVGGIYVFNTDMVVQSTDLLPGMSLGQLARKCVISNYSDLAAKGAKPLLFLASIGLPKDLEDKDFISIMRGLQRGVSEYDSYLSGGDISEANEVIIAGFAAGRVLRRLVSRKDAQPGDLIFTTGSFGLTSLAYMHLLEGMDLPPGLRDLVLRAVYEPVAKVEQGICISEFASSSTDSSDGLYWSLKELSRASGYGYVVDNLPIDKRILSFVERAGLDPTEVVFHGGEEYELVFTVSPDKVSQLEEVFERRGWDLLKIGHVISEPGVFLKHNENFLEVREGGWEHFKSERK
ncbi:MAG: thiamine-phosphate kinase [Thermoproteota archaeon]|nr:MAG: thiamine-phosphate kinase [Candidatus Korarchaeota archaeon]